MKIASIHSGQDTGGQSIRLKMAFDKYAPDWEFRAMNQRATYINYPTDLPWRKRNAEQVASQADVIHWHNGYGTARSLKMTHRPAVVHQHGTVYRADPDRFIKECEQFGGINVVSTLDLWVLRPDDAIWLPAPYDIDWLLDLRAKARPDKLEEVERLRKMAPRRSERPGPGQTY